MLLEVLVPDWLTLLLFDLLLFSTSWQGASNRPKLLTHGQQAKERGREGQYSSILFKAVALVPYTSPSRPCILKFPPSSSTAFLGSRILTHWPFRGHVESKLQLCIPESKYWVQKYFFRGWRVQEVGINYQNYKLADSLLYFNWIPNFKSQGNKQTASTP